MNKYKISLNHGVGSLSKPIVKIGEKVLTGQKIAEADGLGCNISSSIDGFVVKITNDYIYIEGNPSDEYVRLDEKLLPLQAIEEAGIVGCGGAGFPTHIKLANKITDGTLYINAAECEPLLKHNIEYIKSNMSEFVDGIKLVVDILGCSKAMIAIKSKHCALISELKEFVKSDYISIGVLSNSYPAGDERVIVRELHGIELAPGELPIVHDIVVLNVETIKNIYNAIVNRKPVITKDFTVGGKIENLEDSKSLFNIPIGTIIKDVIDGVGNIQEPYGEILVGGPFTGEKADLEDSIGKTSSGIYVTSCFPNISEKFGVINCDCGANPSRMEYLVKQMGGEVIATKNCKRMIEVNGKFRCEKPGECPGQAEVCLALKKAGATAIIMSTCED